MPRFRSKTLLVRSPAISDCSHRQYLREEVVVFKKLLPSSVIQAVGRAGCQAKLFLFKCPQLNFRCPNVRRWESASCIFCLKKAEQVEWQLQSSLKNRIGKDVQSSGRVNHTLTQNTPGCRNGERMIAFLFFYKTSANLKRRSNQRGEPSRGNGFPFRTQFVYFGDQNWVPTCYSTAEGKNWVIVLDVLFTCTVRIAAAVTTVLGRSGKQVEISIQHACILEPLQVTKLVKCSLVLTLVLARVCRESWRPRSTFSQWGLLLKFFWKNLFNSGHRYPERTVLAPHKKCVCRP